MRDIEFWFSLGSTYTYLTVSRIRKFQEKKDFNLIFRPFSVRDVMKSMDNIPFPVSKKSTEVHGGMGFTDLLGLHYWFKRIGLNRHILGSPEIVRKEAARVQGL